MLWMLLTKTRHRHSCTIDDHIHGAQAVKYIVQPFASAQIHLAWWVAESAPIPCIREGMAAGKYLQPSLHSSCTVEVGVYFKKEAHPERLWRARKFGRVCAVVGESYLQVAADQLIFHHTSLDRYWLTVHEAATRSVGAPVAQTLFSAAKLATRN